MAFKLFILLITHVVGDIVLQWATMDKLKMSNIKWLLFHVFIYALLISICFYFVLGASPKQTAIAGILSFVSHLLVDYLAGKQKIKHWSEQLGNKFFTIIIIDHLVHIIILFAIFFGVMGFSMT